METSALSQPAPNRYPRVAGTIHTILVLAALGGWAFWHKMSADRLSVAANPNRVRFYLGTLLFEWLLFVLVVVGVRRGGDVCPPRSRRSLAFHLPGAARSWHCRWVLVLRGCSFGYWAGSCASLAGSQYGFMLSHRRRGTDIMDSTLGYEPPFARRRSSRLLAKAVAWLSTRSAPAGIRLSAAAFGAAHAYQGLGMANSDRPVRSVCSGFWPIGAEAFAWNDRARVAGFIERSAGQCNEALEAAGIGLLMPYLLSDGQCLMGPVFDRYSHLLESSFEEVITGFDAY